MWQTPIQGIWIPRSSNLPSTDFQNTKYQVEPNSTKCPTNISLTPGHPSSQAQISIGTLFLFQSRIIIGLSLRLLEILRVTPLRSAQLPLMCQLTLVFWLAIYQFYYYLVGWVLDDMIRRLKWICLYGKGLRRHWRYLQGGEERFKWFLEGKYLPWSCSDDIL